MINRPPRDYTGKVVIGEVVEKGFVMTDCRFYNMKARLRTGPLRKSCLVQFGGGTDDIKAGQEILIRLDVPIRSRDLYHAGCALGNMVTRDVPDGFDYSEAKDTLFHAITEEWMASGGSGKKKLANIGDIQRHFNIGHLYRPMHIDNPYGGDYDGTPVYYILRKITPLPLDEFREIPASNDYNPGRAVRGYLNFMNTDSDVGKENARVVTVDWAFRDRNIIDPTKLFTPENLGIKHCIEMEPHIPKKP